jgi:GTP-binding protein HflX
VVEKDILFATLDTYIRKISLPGFKDFLLSDTVGFVSNLPHYLVKAFRSTLEEVRRADLLLHIVDISAPDYEEQMRVTDNTLQEIGAENIPTIYVFNKIDLTSDYEAKIFNNRVFISAAKKVGLNLLLKEINRELLRKYIECCMFIPYNQGKLLSYLNNNAYIKSVKHENEGTILTLECLESDYKKFHKFVCTE